ncbi:MULTISPECIES: TRAP transporter small permease [Rhodobacterales]|uniref:TRAP transporter small permease n=1 Tax=Rhodobacterales TaxID=204455 RepID=UPI00215D8E17|nr:MULTISPECIES: TRAP transporter small permease [Rhodobacterales]MDO6591180.1 TRAP transporter small permease [Yoonia sp. 1_MG-2023]
MLGAVEKLCIFIASISLVILIVTYFWLAFGRKVLNDSPTWVEQLSFVLICYIVFLGAAAGVRNNTHLGVTVFRDMMPVMIQKVLIVSIDLIVAAFGLVMMVSSWRWVAFGWDSLIPMLDVPESIRSAAICIFGGLIFIFAGMRAISRILTFSTWLPEEPFSNDPIETENL